MFQIQTNPLGCFAIRDGKIISHSSFISGQSTEITAKSLIYARKNLLPEECKIAEDLSKSKAGCEIGLKNCERAKQDKTNFENVRFVEISQSKIIPIEEIAEQIMIDPYELKRHIWSVNLEITKEEMRAPEIDRVAIQLISTVDELNNTVNLMDEQLHEYYGAYFPEIDAISDHEIYASVAALGNRENLDLKNINLSEKIKEKLRTEGIASFGMKLDDKYISGASLLAGEILNLYKLKAELEENLKRVMIEISPNLSYLAGHMLGARLLLRAGSLEKLAFMPASTVQMLGAEKALFKFLRTKKLPPKHGIIFTLSEICTAQKKDRGKISRNFAAKVSIAAKVDYFKGDFVGKELKEKFNKVIENLKHKRH
ncbi:MAG: hypothetical protein BWK75_03145 [Candidatus Altiarchaeales archaeon A3]|nr:MAG: hypothetical protein BWK75_03145 [Candidatus Altiarchaeales archaeon A3]